MSIFDELNTSLQEAVEIQKGKTKASRVTRHEVADVRAIRAKLHVSQAEFADAMGTSPTRRAIRLSTSVYPRRPYPC
ncbi:NadS family protein [Halomonas sp. CSM-2]|uniref:NadS family protein n=1 Tax=Halomonas sp. CSM-2 TaxID=1975722 RepID=UPI0026E1F8E9|nr:NadS family protein [Halomonas sp. CSM-2]